MLPSWRLASTTLAGRPGRTTLMIGAVALAASLVVAVSCAMDSAQSSLERGITRFIGRTQVRVIHLFNSRFDASVLEKVRSWPQVDVATGRLGAVLTLAHADGRIDP